VHSLTQTRGQTEELRRVRCQPSSWLGVTTMHARAGSTELRLRAANRRRIDDERDIPMPRAKKRGERTVRVPPSWH
jgi:hypothetical protein